MATTWEVTGLVSPVLTPGQVWAMIMCVGSRPRAVHDTIKQAAIDTHRTVLPLVSMSAVQQQEPGTGNRTGCGGPREYHAEQLN
jgi:hypothetical protein